MLVLPHGLAYSNGRTIRETTVCGWFLVLHNNACECNRALRQYLTVCIMCTVRKGKKLQ